MATVFYPSYDVCLIGLAGQRVPLRDTTVDAYNLTQSSSLGTVVSDEFGIVPEGSFTANVLDVVEFSVAGYTETIRFVLQSTQAKAYTAPDNSVNTFIVANYYNVTNESEIADVYVTDNGDPTIPPQKIGSTQAGETTVIPYPVTAQKNLKVHLISKSVKGQLSSTDFAQTESFDITIPGPSGVKFEPLFDEFEDQTTTGTTRETLCQYSMPTGILDHTGDKIQAEYAGIFAANGNSKSIHISFAGTDIFDSTALTENATHWSAKATIIRASQTAVRSIVNFSSDVHHNPVVTEVGSLDLNANGYDLELDGHTSASAGDLTVKLGYGMLVPRKPQTAFGTQLSGFSLAFVPGTFTGSFPDTTALGGLYLEFVPGTVDHYFFPSAPPDDPSDWPLPCFIAGTLVWMADGTAKRIEEIVPGDLVMSWTSDCETLSGRVKAFTGGKGGVYHRLTFASDVLECTPRHPFWTASGQKIAAEDMKAGDLVKQFHDVWGFDKLIANTVIETEEQQFYNWEIEDHHTYFVRNKGAWKAVFNLKQEV